MKKKKGERTMFEDVKKLLADQLKIEEEIITPEARIKEDLGADSLDILQLLMTFEKVSDIVAYLEKQKN